MKIIAFRPQCWPVVEEVNNDLRTLQDFVGGEIEVVPIFREDDEELTLICNLNGKILGLPPNRSMGTDIIVGDFLVCANRMTEDGLDFDSLTDQQIPWVIEKFKNVVTDMRFI